MLVLEYILGVVFFCGVYLLGKWMAGESLKWADALSMRFASRYASRGTLGKTFEWVGWTVQVVAVIWGFLDVVAVLVLATAM